MPIAAGRALILVILFYCETRAYTRGRVSSGFSHLRLCTEYSHKKNRTERLDLGRAKP